LISQTVKNLDKAKAAEKAAAEAKLANEANAKAQEQLRNDLTETKRKLGATEEKLRAKEQAVNELMYVRISCMTWILLKVTSAVRMEGGALFPWTPLFASDHIPPRNVWTSTSARAEAAVVFTFSTR